MGTLTIAMIDPTTGLPGTDTLEVPDEALAIAAPLYLQRWNYPPMILDPDWPATIPDPDWTETVPDPAWQAEIADPENAGLMIPNPDPQPDIPNPEPQGQVANPTPQPTIRNPISPGKWFLQHVWNDIVVHEALQQVRQNVQEAAHAEAAVIAATIQQPVSFH